MGGVQTHNLSRLLLIIFLAGFYSCVKEETSATKAPPLFRLLESDSTGLDFSNDLPVDVELNIFNYMYYYNGGGLASADFNRDGLIDLYFTSNLGTDKLYLNRGGLKFEDVTDVAGVDCGSGGWTTGPSIVDINQDGKLDIYVCQVGSYRSLDAENKLFICTGFTETGIPTYEERAAEYGLNFKGFSTQAGFLDFDRDGDMDMYLMNHSLHHNGTFGQRATFLQENHPTSGDKFFINENGHFKDATEAVGIQSSVIGYGLGLAIGDINLDGWMDIYIGNDFHENDYLYLNQQDGTFKEVLPEQMRHTSRFSMGVDMADLNKDGFMEVISLDMLPEDPSILKRSEGEDALDIFNFKLGYGYNHQFARNCLQLNNTNGTFSEIGAYSGVYATDWSWSPLFFDMDLDGTKDLFVSNGIPKRMNDIDYIDFVSGNDLQYKIQFDQLEPSDMEAIDRIPEIKLENKFFLGSDSLVFRDMESLIEGNKPSYSNSAIYADLDNDGDIDVVTNNIGDSAFLYENLASQESRDRSLVVYPLGNNHALGTRLITYKNGQVNYEEVQQVRGFQSSMINPIILVEPADGFDSMLLVTATGEWGTCRLDLRNPDDNLLLPIGKEPRLQGQFDWSRLHPETESSLTDLTESIAYLHQENPFVEFNREVLIPHAVSREGPAIAVGDINGDGLNDVFAGAAKRRVNGLYIQQPNGRFQRVESPALRADSIFEDVYAAIEDFDGDGDNDLLIGTGGNEFRLGHPNTAPLLYLNDGKGELQRREDAFTEVSLTTGAMSILDFDGDGDLDIFLGARAKPWNYSETSQSYLLLNDGEGKFTELNRAGLDGLTDIGLVRSSAVADWDQDGDDDLLVGLEWGGIYLFENTGGKFKQRLLQAKAGWWSELIPADVDGDGDLDLLALNQGLNHRFRDRSMKLYYDDFDDNSTKEQLISYELDGREIPFHNKKELEKQMPFIKKKFFFAKDFARADVKDIFPEEKLRSPLVVEQFQSLVLVNESGKYRSVALPWTAQLTPYQTGQEVDANGDAFPDFLLFGNFYHANIQMGRYDADYGTLLIGKGDGTFERESLGGVAVTGQCSQLVPLGDDKFVLGRNDDSLKLIQFNRTTLNP